MESSSTCPLMCVADVSKRKFLKIESFSWYLVNTQTVSFSSKLLTRQSNVTKILDGVSFPITLTNSSSEFIYANPAFTLLYSWTEQDLLGLTPEVLLPRDLAEPDLKLLRKQITNTRFGEIRTLRNRNKNGDIILIELATFSISLHDGIPANINLGISSIQGNITAAINSLFNSFFRFSHEMITNSSIETKIDKFTQIKNLYACGYNTKEIAGFMKLGLNTPHVIMHRARRNTKSNPSSVP